MSTVYYAPSRSAAETERYVRGDADERGAAITCDLPGGPGVFAARARVLTQNTGRQVQALHYRQSFSASEFSPESPEDVQRANDIGYRLAKRMHPHSDALVVTHTDGRGHKVHNHVVVINHDNETGNALADFRTFIDRPEAGGQHGVRSINDALMMEEGLSVASQLSTRPKDWELRREQLAEGSLGQQMGDRIGQALMDPRSVDRNAFESVLAEQNSRPGFPQLRLHSVTSKHGSTERWTYYITDNREDRSGHRSEVRHRASALSTEFTPEGAQAFFDYHLQHAQKEKRIHATHGQPQGARPTAGDGQSARRADLADRGDEQPTVRLGPARRRLRDADRHQRQLDRDREDARRRLEAARAQRGSQAARRQLDAEIGYQRIRDDDDAEHTDSGDDLELG